MVRQPGRPDQRRAPSAPIPIDQLEDLDISREIECIDFEVGDNVVYPHHGAGQVIKKEEKDILGEKRQYLTIKILHNDMTVMVPCENAGKAGLRRVIDEETVKKVLAVLSDDVSEMPKNWNRRFKHNRDKIKTGDIYELAEVVRNLAIREQDKGLSTGEKQMFTRAKKILASELMYALEMGEEEAELYLDSSSRGRSWRAPRRAAAGTGTGRRGDRLVAAGAANALGPTGPRRSSSSPGARSPGRWTRRRAAGVPRVVVAVAARHGAAAEAALGGPRPASRLGLALVEGGATRSASVRTRRRAGRRGGRRPRRRAAAGRPRLFTATLAAPGRRRGDRRRAR